MNYKLNFKKELPYIKSDIHLFTHLKSSAKLVHISNNDDNKVFSIAFKTVPFDNTGVFHIIEHCVLSGSEKYSAKDPFNELLKGSLHTFLNAITYNDKTVYPIASKNDEEFFKLMSIYLDSVFFPLIYERKNIFLQEAHRIEISKTGEASLSGIVLNEMKGSYSSPERVLSNNICINLFPDTQYRFDSGGVPGSITDLTYEEFLAVHKKYYHPSNSVIYLYGDCNIDKCLSFINDEYLSKFDKLNTDIKIKEQSVVSAKSTVFYSCHNNIKDNNYLALSFVIDKFSNCQLVLSISILSYILIGTNTAPLKSCLLEYGFGKDINSLFGSNIYQPVFSIIAKNSSSEDIDKFCEVIYDKLNDLATNGIDSDLINAAINKWEFLLSEEDYEQKPRGLIYGLAAICSVFYDDFSFDVLQQLKLLENIKNEINNGTSYFENIIKKYFLDNKHVSRIKMMPREEKTVFDCKIPFLTNFEKNQIKQQNLLLRDYQNTPDPPEILNQIPIISIEKINKLPEYNSFSKIVENNYTIISSNIDTNDIIYLELLFDSTSVPQNLLPYVGLLAGILGNVNTKNYDIKTIHKLVNKNIGKLTFLNDVFIPLADIQNILPICSNYKPKFILKTKFMLKNINDALNIINEILINTKFDNIDDIKKLIRQVSSRMRNNFIQNASTIAISRCLSFFSQANKYNDIVAGIDFYDFICSIEKDIDSKSFKIDEIVNNLYLAYQFLINKSNLTIGVTCSNNVFNKFYSSLNILLNNMNSFCDKYYSYSLNSNFCSEGIIAPVKVQYNVCGSNFIKAGFSYSGKLLVLKTLIDDYLWNTVRVHGGAYGCGSSFTRFGNMYLFSFRDPNLVETYNIYGKISKYINDIDISERQLRKYIIGTVNLLDKPKSNTMKNNIAIARSLMGVSYDDLKIEREEVLSVSLTDIKNLYDMLNECLTNKYICSIGSEDNIKDHKSLFTTTRTLERRFF